MLLTVDNEAAILHSRASGALLQVLQQLEGRRSWKDNGRSLHCQPTQHNIDLLSSLPNVRLQDKRAAPAEPIVVDHPDVHIDFDFKTDPYPHQKRALAQASTLTAFGMFSEQGTGKSKIIIDWGSILFEKQKITGVLIVSKKGVHRQWIESELPEHCAVPFISTFYPAKDLHEKSPDRLEFFAINWDSIWRPEGRRLIGAFLNRHYRKVLVAADESQEMKNSRSNRHKAMMSIRSAIAYSALVTGTPIAKDLTDEWAQLLWLDESIIGIRYITTFRSTYCIMGGFKNKQVIGHRDIEKFKAKTAPYIFRATKAELGIEAKQYATWHFDMAPEQLRAMRDMKRELEALLESGDIVRAKNSAVAMGKMQQIAAGFLLDGTDPDTRRVHYLVQPEKNPRLLAAMEWVDADDGKFIIWTRFHEEIDMIKEALDERGITYGEYHGRTSDKNREAAKVSFLDAGGVRGLISNPQSGGAGLNLQGLCTRALYYTNSFQYIARVQSEDRIHRIGTKGICTYTDLVAKGGPDNYIRANLRKKKGLAQLVLDDFRELLDEMG